MNDIEKHEERIESCKTFKQCETLAKNYRDHGHDDLADKADKHAANLRYRQLSRRPPIDYHYIGLKTGQELKLPALNIVAKVADYRNLLYKGKYRSFTSISNELKSEGIRDKDTKNWIRVDTGEKVNDLYEKAWPKKSSVEK
jgi:hypothetical protein